MKLDKSTGRGSSFLDTILVIIIFLFVVIWLILQLINPIAKNATIKKAANYLIVMEWDKNINCDVDMWVKGPDGTLVSFVNKTSPYMHLERDDTGHGSDSIVTENGETLIIAKENREVWTLRGAKDGEYVVNNHVYNCILKNLSSVPGGSGSVEEYARNIGVPVDLMVKTEVIRVNPVYQKVLTTSHRFTAIWQEKTVAKFTLASEGKDFQYEPNPPTQKLVRSRRAGTIPSSGVHDAD